MFVKNFLYYLSSNLIIGYSVSFHFSLKCLLNCFYMIYTEIEKRVFFNREIFIQQIFFKTTQFLKAFVNHYGLLLLSIVLL